MKPLSLLAAAALTLGGLTDPVAAQQTVTNQRVLPNGDVRTSTTVHNGGMDHRMDRMDGRDRTVVSERVVRDEGRGWHRGHRMHRVCKTRSHHGERVRKCWTRRG